MGYDHDLGQITVDVKNGSDQPVTAYRLEIAVTGADGRSMGIRGLGSDLVADRDAWILPGGEARETFTGFPPLGDPDLVVVEPRVRYAIFQDGSSIGDREKVRDVETQRLANALELRPFVMELAALGTSDDPEQMLRGLERLVSTGEEAVVHRQAAEAEAFALRESELATSEGRRRFAARDVSLGLEEGRLLARQHYQSLKHLVDAARRSPESLRAWYDLILEEEVKAYETLVENLGPELSARFLRETEAER